MTAKTLTAVLIAFCVLFFMPFLFGLLGSVMGLIGGLVGMVVGLVGHLVGAVMWLAGNIFHALFSWHTGFTNGIFVAVGIVAILVLLVTKRHRL